MKNCIYAIGMTVTSLVSSTTHANVVPSSGQLLQEQQQVKSNLPQSKADLEMTIPPQTGLQGDLQVEIQHIVIEGNTQFDSATLHVLVADAEGKSIALNQLQSVVDRITLYYQQQGYLYSRAYLPQQTLSGGIVKIGVLEAKIDTVNIDNQSRTQDWLLTSTLSPLKSGDHISYDHIQQQLKLVNRLNGVTSRNILSPGSTTGTSNLNIQVNDQQHFQGAVGVDNFGNEYVGHWRTNATLAVNNLLGLGDQLTLDGMTTGQGLNYAKIGYAVIVNGLGTELGLSHSHLSYDLGKGMKDLDAEGTAVNSSVWLKHPLLFTHQNEVFLSLQYDHKALEDDIRVNDYYKHRDLDVLTIKVDASQYDQWAGGGLTQYGVSTSYGHVDYKNAIAAQVDRNSVNTQGDFSSSNVYVTRLQNLNKQGTRGYVALSGQYSPDNIDSSEQYISGGAFSVRGYEQSQFSGSSGYLVTGELRHPVYQGAGHHFTGKVFADYARLKFNANPWVGLTSTNYVDISSAGIGLQWQHIWNLQANLDIAFPLGSRPELLNSRESLQIWFELKNFF